MTTTPPEAPADRGADDDTGPRTHRDEVLSLNRIRRATRDKKVAGVAAGLARHLDIDPVILRVAFVVLTFFGGAGLAVYGACWLLLPEDDGSEAAVRLDDRSRSVALVLVGIAAAGALVGDAWGVFGFPWQLAVIGLVVVLVLNRKERRGAQRPPYQQQGWVAPPVPPVPSGGWVGDPTATTVVPNAPAPYAVRPHAIPEPAPVRPDPRRRGPVLFWFTLALIALCEGVLGILDLAGAPIAAPAYPAVALGVTGLMLLVGAFYGRAGGLILVGLVSAVALAGTSVADEFDGTRIDSTPTTADEVAASYDIDAGEIVLDLRDLTDLEALDGRTIDLEATFGSIEVLVPDGLDVRATGAAHGAGHIDLFGDESGGVDSDLSRFRDGGSGAPSITIDAEVTLGEIRVATREEGLR